MQIIPVIDLLNGVVVHAKKGDRQNYKAMQSLLTHSSNPLAIIAALLEYYPFQHLYIADLNAIQGLNNDHKNVEVIQSITQHYPKVRLWIDAGLTHKTALDHWCNRNFNVVLGSENFSDLEHFLDVSNPLHPNWVLSLDFMPNGYQGPATLQENTQYWPKDVIMMSLANVGANAGVNTELLEKFKQYATHFNLYAAGGVRGMDDLTILKQAGIHGALIATALHQKQLSYSQLEELFK